MQGRRGACGPIGPVIETSERVSCLLCSTEISPSDEDSELPPAHRLPSGYSGYAASKELSADEAAPHNLARPVRPSQRMQIQKVQHIIANSSCYSYACSWHPCMLQCGSGAVQVSSLCITGNARQRAAA